MILTLDLGTSTTKAIVWDADGPHAEGRAPLETTFAAGDRAEQDPADWWRSVVAACAEARAGSSGVFDAVQAVGFAAARQTFVPVTDSGEALGPAIVWSDRRAGVQALALADRLGGMAAARRRTGAVLDGAALAAKAAWLAAHDPDRLAESRWLLTPRDLVVLRMTGEVATDLTMVSAAGLCDPSGEFLPELLAVTGGRIPPVLSSMAVAGILDPAPAAELGLRSGLPVCIGAGDRACEMLGTAAGSRPMVSWGTTANASLLVDVFPDPPPDGLIVTKAATGGWLLEGGLSAAGSLLAWLSALTGLDHETLMTEAAASPAGASGVVALPWFGGARAPWWRPNGRGAFVGLSFDHDAGDLARAAIESVAWDVRRCLVTMGAIAPQHRPAAASVALTSLVLTGSDGRTNPWPAILTAVTGMAAVRRRTGQAASAGAALLAATAIGARYDLDRLDPVVDTLEPDPTARARYAELAADADAAAHAVLALGDGGDGT